MLDFKRASNAESVEERTSSIIRAAILLFRANDYDEISLNRIASSAKMAKSNVYRYFSTREEIFLEIYMGLLSTWSDELLQTLGGAPKNISVDKYARCFAQITLRHRDLLRLCPHVFVSLEKNSSGEHLRRFKDLTLQISRAQHDQLRRFFPALSLEDVVCVFKIAFAIMSTYWRSDTHSKELNRLEREKTYRALVSSFEKELTRAIKVSLIGLSSMKSKRKLKQK